MNRRHNDGPARKPLIYIAGPYTNPDPVLNVRRAVEVGEEVSAHGMVPVVPHLTMFWHLISPHPLEWWYAHDLDLLAHCHAIFRFPGASTGADAEVEFARARGIPVFESMDALREWAATR